MIDNYSASFGSRLKSQPFKTSLNNNSVSVADFEVRTKIP